MSLVENTRLHALIIEDNIDLARLFGDLLEIMGCTVDIASNAKSGLELLDQHAPDILFCDLKIPGEKNGFDVAREIRANPAHKNRWLIAVTGLGHPENLESARQAGFDRVYSKPIKFAELQSVLDDYRAAMQS